MGIALENVGVLLGLGVLALPVLIHLLSRRRHVVIDWAAMQFLPAGHASRRRRWLDDLPLLLLRLGILALIVTALATPVSDSPLLAPLADGPARDVVLVLDGSFSMGRADGQGRTAWQEATDWARDYVTHLGRGDRVALLVARQPPLHVTDGFVSDRSILTGQIDRLPAPRGNAGNVPAVAEGWKRLRDHGTADRREIIVLTDRQHHGWAADAALAQWAALGRQLAADRESVAGQPLPSLRVRTVGGTPAPANTSLAALVPTRGVVTPGHTVTFRSAVHAAAGPVKLRVDVDGKPLTTLAPSGTANARGQVPVEFSHDFDTPGQHPVTLTLEPADPEHAAPDRVQHAVVEVVPAIRVLVVDGGELTAAGGSFFVRRALEGSPGQPGGSPVVLQARRVHEFTPDDLTGDAPRVVILADVPGLTAGQRTALDIYVERGGSVLVAAGPRATAAAYDELYRGGAGWLPARLVAVAGENGPAVQPEPRTFAHPALELFRREPNGTLGQARFKRWWKVATDARHAGTPVALLSNGDPLLVEKKPATAGRCSAPSRSTAAGTRRCRPPGNSPFSCTSWCTTWPGRPRAITSSPTAGRYGSIGRAAARPPSSCKRRKRNRRSP
jgi:hypothetical protein